MIPNNSERDMQSLFITFNEHSIPERMAHLCWSKNDPNVPDNLFLKYLRDESIQAQKANRLPDCRVCRYDFQRSEISENQILDFSQNGAKLRDYITDNGFPPAVEISLRTAATVNLLTGNVGELDVLVGLTNSTLEDHPLQKLVNRMSTDFMNFDIFNTWDEQIGVVHTDQGALLFPDTGRGKACCKSYMQYLADNFFCQKEIHTATIGLSLLQKSSLNIEEMADQTIQMFSLLNDSFLPEKAHYFQLGNNPVKNYDVLSDFQTFKNFIKDFDLEQSPRNRDVCALLFIAKNGFVKPVSFQQFSNNEDFKALAELEGRMPDDELQTKHQTLACSILREKYGLDVEGNNLRKDNTQKPITQGKHYKL